MEPTIVSGRTTLRPLPPVNILEPHHSTTVLYPGFGLLKPGEEPAIMLPADSGERYEPLPIVPLQPVIANKTGGKESTGTDFTVFLPVTSLTHHGDDLPELAGELDADMKQLLAYVGRTKVRLLLIAKDPSEHDDGDDLAANTVRVSRFTQFVLKEGRTRISSSQYDIPYRQFVEYPNSPHEGHYWRRDAVELIDQITERAARHVKLRLAISGITDVGREWKAPRGIKIDVAILKVASVMSKSDLKHFNSALPDDEHITQCPVCLDDFCDPGTEVPVRLPCAKKHVVCRSCLREWCNVNGIINTKCAWCAIKLASPEISDCLQPNYLDMESVYKNDERYTAFENHERQCADLDRDHAQCNETVIRINNNRLLVAWDKIVQHQPGSDTHTWYWRDPSMAWEYADVKKTFVQFCDDNDGKTLAVQEAYNQIREVVYTNLRDKFCSSGIYEYTAPKQKEAIKANVYKVPLRPGFSEWIDCSLSRVLQFQTVRQCMTHDECAEKRGLHLHGDRGFFKDNWCTQQAPTRRDGAMKLRLCKPKYSADGVLGDTWSV